MAAMSQVWCFAGWFQPVLWSGDCSPAGDAYRHPDAGVAATSAGAEAATGLSEHRPADAAGNYATGEIAP